MITAHERLTPMLGASPTKAAIARATGIDPKTGIPTLMRTPVRPIFGHGAILSMRRLGDKAADLADVYAGIPAVGDINASVEATRRNRPDRGTRTMGTRPPESVFTRSKKYAGERGGFKVYRETGALRRIILRARKARDALLSAVAAEDADIVGKVSPEEVIVAAEVARAEVRAEMIEKVPALPKKRAAPKKAEVADTPKPAKKRAPAKKKAAVE